MKIECDEASHTYRIDGICVPNPTRIFEALGITDYSNIPPAILEASQRFGIAVHKTCELYIRENLDEKTLDPLIKPRLDGFRKFLRDTRAVFLQSELIVGSKAYMFACRLDLVVSINGKLEIIEIKTGADQQLKSAAYQTAAQQIGFQEFIGKRIAGRRAILLQDDGNYKQAIYKNKSDTGAFLSMLSTYNVKMQLRKAG